MGPSAIGLKAMIEMCSVDRVLFGTDFGPVPMSPKVHIDLVNDTMSNTRTSPTSSSSDWVARSPISAMFSPVRPAMHCRSRPAAAPPPLVNDSIKLIEALLSVAN